MELDGSGLGMGPYTKGMVWEWDHTQRGWSGNGAIHKGDGLGMGPYTKGMVWNETMHNEIGHGLE